MTLNDFANGYTPGYVDGVINRKYKPGSRDVQQVQAWIDEGLLFEADTNEPSALVGKLYLTEKGRMKCGLGEVVPVTKPVKVVSAVKESQGELF